MKDHASIPVRGQRELGGERPHLRLGIRPQGVQPDLADAEAGMGREQRLQPLQPVLRDGGVRTVPRMEPAGRLDAGL